VVADTGVLVSGAINKAGNPHRLLMLWREGELSLILCPTLLNELANVLGRSRLRPLIDPADAREFVEGLRLAADVRGDPAPVSGLVPGDPDDDYVVALAREAGASYIVASDKHLLSLKSPRPPVITPRDLVAEVGRRR
jgi:uncharacterized protein